MKIQVNDEVTTIDFPSFNSLMLSELELIQDRMGAEVYEATIGAGRVSDPRAVRHILWVRLRRDYPDLEPGDFDLQMGDFTDREDPPTTGG